MKSLILAGIFLMCMLFLGCRQKIETAHESADTTFAAFEDIFLDSYWKQYPIASIFNGYGKYYESLVIPDSNAVNNNIKFSRQWLDSLGALNYEGLSDNNKISFNIIKNWLESDIWYADVFKDHKWNASLYNLSWGCYYIINQPYAPLDDRLRILSKHLEGAERYYEAAFKTLLRPTREHIQLSILQNEGGLSIFGKSLTDSIKISGLTDIEKNTLNENINKTIQATKTFIADLKKILSDRNYEFRSFRIGKELFDQKFRYDLVTTFTPQEIYDKAVADKKMYYDKMYITAGKLWRKYFGNSPKPADTLALIQTVIDKISLQHAKPEHFFDSLTNHVYRLKKFIIQKNLFDFDTAYPMKVRIMPAFMSGVAVANAEFTPPYQKEGETYYNIDDLTTYPKEKAESTLREYNDYASQLLSIHEAVPGHCLQGIYNNKKSGDVLRSVFTNGAMIEGWAVYTEGMMLDNGWGGHSLEMELTHGKMKLRELANVIIDYDLHCLNKSKESIMNLMVRECFQTAAQAEEKYHRATVSQVQLCSYYTGHLAIEALRDEYQQKMGTQYNLKDFHEKFLSFGSSPIKYIRERMLE